MYDADTLEYYVRHSDRTERAEMEEQDLTDDKPIDDTDMPALNLPEAGCAEDAAAAAGASAKDDGNIKDLEDRLLQLS